jgi:hypothetical protein
VAVARRLSALAFACVASLTPAAQAQALLTLHVRSFSMSLDKTTVRVGETFHLTIAAHVDQQLLELDNVTLPDFSGFEISGDERRCSSSRRGTDCVEVLTLDATQPGIRTLAPTGMDAIDARNGKPSRFLTNSVTIEVGPPTLLSSGLPSWLRDALLAVLRQIALLLVGLAALAALIWALARRKPRPPASVAPPLPPASAPAGNGASWQSLLAALAAEPSRPRVVAVREALRKRVGARDDETLADLVARRASAGDESVRAALAAVERAAFCEDERLDQAVRAALPLLERLGVAASGAATGSPT